MAALRCKGAVLSGIAKVQAQSAFFRRRSGRPLWRRRFMRPIRYLGIGNFKNLSEKAMEARDVPIASLQDYRNVATMHRPL
jgi:hypothetical protein